MGLVNIGNFTVTFWQLNIWNSSSRFKKQKTEKNQNKNSKLFYSLIIELLK